MASAVSPNCFVSAFHLNLATGSIPFGELCRYRLGWYQRCKERCEYEGRENATGYQDPTDLRPMMYPTPYTPE